jgi:hypothetical protein
VRSIERCLRPVDNAGYLTGRGALHLILLALIAVAVTATGEQASSAADAKPVRAHVRVVEVVKPGGFDLRSAGIGAGAAIAAIGALTASYVLFSAATRSRTQAPQMQTDCAHDRDASPKA